MAVAADYVNVNNLQANIITSIGSAATQTVLHTHVHVVPRVEGDGRHAGDHRYAGCFWSDR